jgi:hypothetical protein
MKLKGKLNTPKKTAKAESGYIVYEGASRFDQKPIVAIITMNTANEKTGNMAQLWILRSDIEPHQAIKTGEDQSICGGCIHRHYTGGACYVTVHQAPLSVYRAYKRGNYRAIDSSEYQSIFTNKGLRFGAYGDPAMIPTDIIKGLSDAALFTTGYTHQWKIKRLRDTLDHVQASVDNLQEYLKVKQIKPSAKSFRVVKNQTELMANEIECLSDSHGLSCAQCKKCDGKTQDIAIMVHGAKASKFNADIEVINV